MRDGGYFGSSQAAVVYASRTSRSWQISQIWEEFLNFPALFFHFMMIFLDLCRLQTPLDNSGLFSALLKFELIGYLGRDFFEAYKEKKEINRITKLFTYY